MSNYKELDLQLFADGGGAGDGGAASGAEGAAADTGVSSADPVRSRLVELGVPPSKIRNTKRANYSPASAPASGSPESKGGSAVNAGQSSQDAADTKQSTEPKAQEESQNKRMTWDEIMADPEYNKAMQTTVQTRLKSAKGAEEMLGKLSPVLEAIGAKYSIDVSDIQKLDVDAVLRAVSQDSSYYEKRADELGVSPEIAQRIDQLEKFRVRREAQDNADIQRKTVSEHLSKLHQQGEALKAKYPNFDLMAELNNNPRFAAMTAPGSLLSVEDAYFITHRDEIMQSTMQSAVQTASQKLSASMQRNAARPVENGTSSQAASTGSMDYRSMSRAQQKAFTKNVRERLQRGEKVRFPG